MPHPAASSSPGGGWFFAGMAVLLSLLLSSALIALLIYDFRALPPLPDVKGLAPEAALIRAMKEGALHLGIPGILVAVYLFFQGMAAVTRPPGSSYGFLIDIFTSFAPAGILIYASRRDWTTFTWYQDWVFGLSCAAVFVDIVVFTFTTSIIWRRLLDVQR